MSALGEIAVAAIAGIVTLIVTILGMIGAKRYGMGPNQEQAIMTYKEVINAQNLRMDQLEEENKSCKDEIKELRSQVDKLTQLTIRQALRITELEGRIKGG